MAGTIDSQLQVQACIGPVFINAVEQDLARTELFTVLCQRDGVHLATFSTAFDGERIAALQGR